MAGIRCQNIWRRSEMTRRDPAACFMLLGTLQTLNFGLIVYNKMAKERLSELQKWILAECLKNLEIHYRDIAVFFNKATDYYSSKIRFMPFNNNKDLVRCMGKMYERIYKVEDYSFVDYFGIKVQGSRLTPKKECFLSNSEKVIISRSLKNLMDKGFLIQFEKWGAYRLTEQGFLKANTSVTPDTNVSFKDYKKEIENRDLAREESTKQIKEALSGLKKVS